MESLMKELFHSCPETRNIRYLTGEESVSTEDHSTRIQLLESLKRLVPSEVWPRIEYLQPQIGCFNRCTFCSQQAGSDVWQLTKRGLQNFLSAVKTLLLEPEADLRHIAEDMFSNIEHRPHKIPPPKPLIGQDRIEHKPGVIFPYLDNDAFSYPYLYEYIKYLYYDFGNN